MTKLPILLVFLAAAATAADQPTVRVPRDADRPDLPPPPPCAAATPAAPDRPS